MDHRPQVVEGAPALVDDDLAVVAEETRDVCCVTRVFAEHDDRRVVAGQQVAQFLRVALEMPQRRASFGHAHVHADGAAVALGRRPGVEGGAP